MKILITGVSGQCGATLSHMLVNNGETVYGLKRRASTRNDNNINDLLDCPNFKVLEGDITDYCFVSKLLSDYKFNQIYNAAALSHVHYSFSHPVANMHVNTLGVLNFLEAIRLLSPKTKFLNFGTSEMFGVNYKMARSNLHDLDGRYDGGLIKIQDLSVPFDGRSPYAISKIASYHLVKLYRAAYNLFCIMPICFNMEGKYRSEDFLTMKVIKYIGRLHREELKRGEKLELGNLSAARDWIQCDYTMQGLILAMNHHTPRDFVFCSGETHTVEEFVQLAFKLVGCDWKDYVVISEKYYRPADVEYLRGSYLDAKYELGWEPPQDSFTKLVEYMVNEELGETDVRKTFTDMDNLLHSIKTYGYGATV